MGKYILVSIGLIVLFVGSIFFSISMVKRYTDKNRLKKPKISKKLTAEYIIASIAIVMGFTLALGGVLFLFQSLINYYNFYSILDKIRTFLIVLVATRIIILLGDLDRIGEKPELRPVYHPKRILKTCIWIFAILLVHEVLSNLAYLI